MWFRDGVLYPVSIFSPFAHYRCAIAGKKLMRKQAHCTTAVTTNVVTAIDGDREDLSRVNITMPVSDAAPTIMVIAISKGEKCPLMMLAIPSTYSQMNTIKVNQNRKSGSPIQPDGHGGYQTQYLSRAEASVRCSTTLGRRENPRPPPGKQCWQRR